MIKSKTSKHRSAAWIRWQSSFSRFPPCPGSSAVRELQCSQDTLWLCRELCFVESLSLNIPTCQVRTGPQQGFAKFEWGRQSSNRTAGRQSLVGGARGGDKGVFFPLWVKSFHLKVSNVPLTALFRSFPFQVSCSFPLHCEMEHEDDRLGSLRCLLWWAAGWRSGVLWVAWLAFPSWALGSTVARPRS